MMVDLSWTDTCFLSVVIVSVYVILRGLHKPHIYNAFKKVFQRPSVVMASIVLTFFLVIGMLDSIHIKTDSLKSNSLLDQLLAPLGEIYEQTYSKPLALKLYPKEMRMIAGHRIQAHPELAYPKNKIHNEQEKLRFLGISLFTSCLLSLGIISLLAIAARFLFKFKWTPVNRTAMLTLFLLLWVMIASYQISRSLHLFGTGQIGQDIFYYAIKSIRTGLVIGIVTTLFMMPLALLAGIAAGYFGGAIDDIIQYVYATLSSIPGVLLISASVLSIQTYIVNHPDYFPTLEKSADARLLSLCLILGVTSWTNLCRLLRAETLKLREIDFVSAAKALGRNNFKIMQKHILPNVMHIVIITLVLDFSFLVLAEAVLSYVGVGVSPMTISWGNMINAARLELAREPIVWWPMLTAFIFMFTLVLASNILADAVRDAFDPRHE